MFSQHTDVSARMKEINQLLSNKFTIEMEKWNINAHHAARLDISLLNACFTENSKK